MRSSAAVLALAVLAASPALSAPIQAFDVEARAIPGAGAQDAANGLGFEAVHQKALRELSDHETLLMTRRGLASVLRTVLGGTQGDSNGLTAAKGIANGLGFGAVGLGVAAAIDKLQGLFGLGKSSRELSEEALEFLARELTDEELQLVVRGIVPGGAPALALRDVGHGASAVRSLADASLKELLAYTALFSTAAALTGAVTTTGIEAIKLAVKQGKQPGNRRAREVFEDAQRELADREQDLVARTPPGEGLINVIHDAPHAAFTAEDFAREQFKARLPLIATAAGSLAGLLGAGGLEGFMQLYNSHTRSTPPRARELVEAAQRELTHEELKLVARAIPNGAKDLFYLPPPPDTGASIGGLVARIMNSLKRVFHKGTSPAQAREVAEALQLLSARADIESRQGAVIADTSAAVTDSLGKVLKQGALFSGRDRVASRFSKRALPAKRELMEAFLAARSLNDLD